MTVLKLCASTWALIHPHPLPLAEVFLVVFKAFTCKKKISSHDISLAQFP